MAGSIKWLMLAVVLVAIGVIVYFVGFSRKSKIEKKVTDIPEEEAGNRLQAKKIYVRYSVIAFAFMLIALIIFLVSKGAGA